MSRERGTDTAPGLRGITVRQPYAWAGAHAGKLVENRGAGFPHQFRGLLLWCAGAGWSHRGATDQRVCQAWWAGQDSHPNEWDAVVGAPSVPAPTRLPGAGLVHLEGDAGPDRDLVFGAVLAVRRLVSTHLATPDCCQEDGTCYPWGELEYQHASGHRVDQVRHLVLEDVATLEWPVPCRGALGLWRPSRVLATEVAEQVPAVAQLLERW